MAHWPVPIPPQGSQPLLPALGLWRQETKRQKLLSSNLLGAVSWELPKPTALSRSCPCDSSCLCPWELDTFPVSECLLPLPWERSKIRTTYCLHSELFVNFGHFVHFITSQGQPRLHEILFRSMCVCVGGVIRTILCGIGEEDCPLQPNRLSGCSSNCWLFQEVR